MEAAAFALIGMFCMALGMAVGYILGAAKIFTTIAPLMNEMNSELNEVAKHLKARLKEKEAKGE